MAYRRYMIDLAFKLPLTPRLGIELNALEDAIRNINSVENINAGLDNEENTSKATWHICHHDEGKPCEAEQGIRIEKNGI